MNLRSLRASILRLERIVAKRALLAGQTPPPSEGTNDVLLEETERKLDAKLKAKAEAQAKAATGQSDPAAAEADGPASG